MYEIIVNSKWEIDLPDYLDAKMLELFEKYFPDNKKSEKAFENISENDIKIAKKILWRKEDFLLSDFDVFRLEEIIKSWDIKEVRNSKKDKIKDILP